MSVFIKSFSRLLINIAVEAFFDVDYHLQRRYNKLKTSRAIVVEIKRGNLFVDDEELVSRSNQTSFPEEGTNRTFMAISTLEAYVNKSHRGRTIRCVAIHESYASKSLSVNVKLDITCKYLNFLLLILRIANPARLWKKRVIKTQNLEEIL